MKEKLVYTVDEVARLLGIARGVAYEQVREGVIPSKSLGKRLVIPKERFHSWLNEEIA